MFQKYDKASAEWAGDRRALVERHFWLIVAAILALALIFRLPALTTRSLWIDELFTEWFASRSFTELWTEVPQYETHPPIYYTLLKLWTTVAGNSELGLRSLSLLASMATVLVTAISGRLIKGGDFPGKSAGLLAAVLLAVNYYSIRDAQNARPYALQTFICTVAVIAALALVARLADRSKAGASNGWLAPALILGVFAGGALLMHNTGLFIALGIWSGLALTLIVTPAGQRLGNFAIFFGAGILALVVWSPYIPFFIEQSRAFSGLGFWIEPKMRDLYSAWMLFLGDGWPAFSLGLALLAFGFFRLAQRGAAPALLVAAILLVPLYTMLAVTFAIKPIYIPRLFAWMVPLGLLVIAFGIVTATRWRWIGFAVALVAVSLAAVRSIEDIDRPIDDWKAIVAEIAENAQPGDVVIASPAEGMIAIGYYARRQAHFPPVVCVPGCYPQRNLPRDYGSNFGAPKLIEADGAIVDRALAGHRRVWLVQVSVQLYDPKNIVRSRIAAARKFVRYFGNSFARVDLFE